MTTGTKLSFLVMTMKTCKTIEIKDLRWGGFVSPRGVHDLHTGALRRLLFYNLNIQ